MKKRVVVMDELKKLDDIIFDWLPNATEDEIDDYFFDIDLGG